MTPFQRYIVEHAETLDLYTTTITRAHGANHPEVFQVRDLYQIIKEKAISDQSQLDLDQEFASLDQITQHYFIPDDVCQTFAGTYQMLAEARHLYQAS
ncbi:iron-sulfur cluster repair di-iron protein, ric [Streptococcus suis]|uniref:iron-sulfur cluster repair di-iron protein, ric n=1 Tax=Streptococcus TaxID=1301 RepID=UPI000CF3AD3C|nr:iron-sulfur cluster repair di-iron protein, ric [Streptococcus suis]